MRFSHHAKNKLRHLGGTSEEAESVVKYPFGKSFESRGNPQYVGVVAGRLVQVVVADDDSDYVITVYEEGRR